MSRPSDNEYGVFFKGYADAATGNSIAELLSTHPAFIKNQLNAIPEEKTDAAYAPGKWTLKQLLQHMIDTERVFSYRALRIARNDKTPLPGFDENFFAANAPVTHRSWQELKAEFFLLRDATDCMIRSFTEEQFANIGTASNSAISLKAICFILYGHTLHHIRIIQERYL